MSDAPGITYQATLPLHWEEATPTDAVLAQARHGNLVLLQALATLESAADKDYDADPAVAKAVERLEAKLDIVLSLLSKLVAQQLEIPTSVPVTLGVRSIQWQAAAILPTVGAIIKLSLHLSLKLPEPLRIFARVTAVQGEHYSAEFLDTDEELEEWITRTLFRYHRRALQARHQF